MKAILRQVRTEFGKAIRKRYEAGETKLKRSEIREWHPEQYETLVCLRGSLQKNAFVGDGRISSTLTEAMGTGGGQIPICIFMKKNNMDKTKRPEGKGWVWDEDEKKWFRIRRLTPRECFRLMGVKESDIDRMMSKETDKKGREVQAISNTQLYKCAGNSIVVDPMALTFENLLFPGNDRRDGKQLTLFDF